jgi:hypothetical protein
MLDFVDTCAINRSTSSPFILKHEALAALNTQKVAAFVSGSVDQPHVFESEVPQKTLDMCVEAPRAPSTKYVLV